MQLPIFQVDAFTTSCFGGNPAAVCPLPYWLDDSTLQKIADENNLSETAFFVVSGGKIALRWFTPEAEVDLCGHATLAAAHVLHTHLQHPEKTLKFDTRSGTLIVNCNVAGYEMDFPATEIKPVATPATLQRALNVPIVETLVGFDYIVRVESEVELRELAPDLALLGELDLRGVVVTAPGEQCDFVSRCFFPKLRVNEDPVTGSAHCELAPYWALELNKSTLHARQISKRSGDITCTLKDDRVVLLGQAVDYLQGTITLP
ncbi:PhzF family phenazine biosynthesis protein [Alteromonas facilis]|uniref:PhzF family phenazine biosynthesis protein n=1 Tax=Alteromonas facilis TaxID=2048004 RepID=UPI000C28427B|nr:PhzF family phenazine biosynthesis protein [Alteromonas facilis]